MEEKTIKVGVVITAAGMSSRMKAFKPLLKIGEHTFAEMVVGVFKKAGVGEIVIVTGYRGEEIRQALQGMEVDFVQNEQYAVAEMFDSAVLGLRMLKDTCNAVFVCPVDVVFFTQHTVRDMVKASGDGDVIIPTFAGRRGHPVLLTERAIRFVLEYSGQEGLQGALKAMEAIGGWKVCLVEVADKGICFDADTPSDYKKCIGWKR